MVNGYKDKIFIVDQKGEYKLDSLNTYNNHYDITEDFCRCVVRYCSEEIEFVVDGMRFRATCERIE
jgi:hypothetical protein